VHISCAEQAGVRKYLIFYIGRVSALVFAHLCPFYPGEPYKVKPSAERGVTKG